MASYHMHDDPAYWRNAPPWLKYAQVFSEAVDQRLAAWALGDPQDMNTPMAMLLKLPPNW